MRKGIQLEFFSQGKKGRVISFIPWHGNPDLSQEPRRLVFGSCALFRLPAEKKAGIE
jgi:hypothetical protein